ncbi:hypothetical protein NDU88_006919 [Pleurodeles waltl]|uniref:Ig-like domain-containing protein n=1 Tax=Pleurodeles waltl TaxID=8319 RepID=A0AAV7QQC5_PLEWA|nr:hypothetical protein NDU88_006919 [Pleurodeles waltl]
MALKPIRLELLVLLILSQRLPHLTAWLWVSTESPSEVRACPGKDVLLSCIFTVYPRPVRLQVLDVYWRRNNKKVARFYDFETDWRSRVSLFPEKLKKGNASLIIYQVDGTYKGHYVCQIRYGRQHQKIAIDLHLRTTPQEIAQCVAVDP